jgi:methanethiol oxidase
LAANRGLVADQPNREDMMTRSDARRMMVPLLLVLGASSCGPATAATEQDLLPDDQSPYVGIFEQGERESFVYVWTRDATGEASDFIAVVDADPASATFGEIVSTAPTGSTNNEAHHFGYTESADRIFAGGMISNRVFVYHIGDDPRRLDLVRTVDLDPTGYTGPHTAYAVPGGVLVTMMGAADEHGSGAIVELDTNGDFVRAFPAPLHQGRPIHLYDVSIRPKTNRMVASGLAHSAHFAHGPPDPEQVGNQIVIWDWEEGEVTQIVEVDAGPAVLRWLRDPSATGGFVNTIFGNSVWFWDEAGDGTLAFERVIQMPEGSLPVDMRVSPDDRYLFVSLWAGGKVQQYDISDPRSPTLIGEAEVPQPNMMRLSPDGTRLYVTNSLLSTLDGDVEFGAWLFHVGPDGLSRDRNFAPDFERFAAGRAGPHDILLR